LRGWVRRDSLWLREHWPFRVTSRSALSFSRDRERAGPSLASTNCAEQSTMADPPAKLGFGFSKTKAPQRKVNVNVEEEGPEKVLLSQVRQLQNAMHGSMHAWSSAASYAATDPGGFAWPTGFAWHCMHVCLPPQVEQGGVFRTVDGQDAATLGQPGKKTYVIAKIENTYKAGTGKFAPSFVPPAQDAPVAGEGEGKFEMAAPVAATVTSYGLQKVGWEGRTGSGTPGSGFRDLEW
jgi:hypothetical protein